MLTARQTDALTELINIAFGRTAASLADLAGQRVILEVPKISLYKFDELLSTIGTLIEGQAATIQQMFSGQIKGNALLLLDYDGAALLTSLILDEEVDTEHFNMSTRDALSEIGNILLNACLGVVGNLLNLHISFSIPNFRLDSLDGVFKSIGLDKEGLSYGLLITTAFHMRDNAVKGYLIILLGINSLDRLLNAINCWEEKQTASEQ